ncbi:MAG: hypothetical protein WAU88_12560 [Candidatus Zixiibacteriota bacterium]
MVTFHRIVLLGIMSAIPALLLGCGDSATAPVSVGTWVVDRSPTIVNLRSVWGSGPTDVFAVGAAGTIVHFDGAEWKVQSSGTIKYLWGVAGTSSNDVYAVGTDGTVIHWDGTAWSSVSIGSTKLLTCVSALAPNDVYIGAEKGAIYHFDGSTWQEVTTGISGFITAIRSSTFHLHPAVPPVRGVVALTSEGSVHLYDGIKWTHVISDFYPGANDLWFVSWQQLFIADAGSVLVAKPTGYEIAGDLGVTALAGIDGSSLNDIWAVGKGMIHFDGTTWSVVSVPGTDGLNDVWIGSTEYGFAVGRDGGIFRHVR